MADRAFYEAALRGLPRERTALLPGLHRLQHTEGFVSVDGMRALADLIRVPAVEVHAAASTYNELRFAPAPENLDRICVGLACRLNGAEQLLQEAEASGATVEQVPCFFACGVAPIVERCRPDAEPSSHGRAVGTVASALLVQFPRKSDESESRTLVGGGSCGRSVGAAALLTLSKTNRLLEPMVEVGCDGACWAQPVVRSQPSAGPAQVYFAGSSKSTAPAARQAISDRWGRPLPEPSNDVAGHAAWLAAQERRITARFGLIDPTSLDDYRATGGYEGLEKALAMAPGAVVDLVEASGLLGRGGAYFPTARKWRTAIDAPGDVYVVVNLEEGEPGVFKDRHLCEGDPHAVVEGTLIAAHAVGAVAVYFYINGQADLSAERIELALEQARSAGYVPEGLHVEVRRGAGGYVCGEESVILNSIEGQRAVPRPRPPLPAEAGLWGHPTVINNGETLASLPLILRHGVEWFRSVGTPQAPGTKLLCVAGAVPRPGLVEVPFGTPLRTVVEEIAGAPPGSTVAVVCGGPSGGLIPAALLDLPVLPGTLDQGGAILGAGGVTVIDGSLSPLEVARHLTAYNAAESCGKCTPCREGTARVEALLRGLLAGEQDEALVKLEELNETIRLASLCGLGQAAPNPVTSVLLHFPPAAGAQPTATVPAGGPAGIAQAEHPGSATGNAAEDVSWREPGPHPRPVV